MKKSFYIIIVLIGFYAEVTAQNKSYFPPGKSTDYSKIDSFEVKWYSEQLEALKEPVLYSDTSGNETYRFTWLRTFDHPIAIRFEKHQNKYFLYWKMCNGAGGYSPGKLKKDKHKMITQAMWDSFIDKINKANFWQLSTREKALGNDGSEWILEGKLASKYHVVSRWTPNAGEYYECCDFLIGLTGLKIPEKEKY